jgi:short-subunit dehydrogenase
MAGHDVPTAINMVHFYSATKHMVTALTKALNSELRQKKSKIRVTVTNYKLLT